jgi:hypothetical protein
MTHITVPKELAERLAALKGPAILIDEKGRVLSRFFPVGCEPTIDSPEKAPAEDNVQ